jgi:hypothetical protein
MYDGDSCKLNVTLAILMLSLITTQVSGQTAPELIVGAATIKPTIDGKWQQGEWDSTIEYGLSQGPKGPVKIPSYLRMMHDASYLYGILDVPSDNGGQYVNTNGDLTAGGAFLAFYYGPFLNPNNQTQLFTFFALNLNETTMHPDVAVYCRCPGQDPNTISSQSMAATGLITTAHSSSKHRVWEFSIPIHPYVIKDPLDTNPAIGFGVVVIDSSGNQISLVNLIQHVSITFVGMPVPDIINGQMILLYALLIPVIVLFAYYRKRGNRCNFER